MWELLHDLDLISFLDDIDINYETSGKNIGTGWVAINPCPFCGDDRNHFAIAISNKRISCWVCGKDGTIIKFLMKYFDTSYDDAFFMVKEHLEETELSQDVDVESLVRKTFTKEVRKVEESKTMPKKVKLLPGRPITTEMMGERPKLGAFLKERMIHVDSCIFHNFRYDYERSMRLIMPIFDYKGDVIAYQGRDITGRAMLKYITMPKGIDLGSTMFNINNYTSEECVVIVEGILDAVRTEKFVKKACVMACFTSTPTIEQLLLLTSAKKVLVMLDNDAWTNYKKFQDLPMDVEPIILPVGKDPGSLTNDEFSNLNLSQYLP